MCEPVTLGVLASAATYGGAAAAGMIGTSAAVAAGTASMTALQAITMAATVGSGVMSAGAAYQQGQMAKQAAENNARMAEYAAQDAVRRGEEDVQAVQRKTSQLSGRQRGLMAARGLDLSMGTPAEILDQTDFFGQTDVNTTRFNAARDAWSLRARGQAEEFEGRMAARNANAQAAGTLLGTAAGAADKWYTWNPSSRRI